MDKLEKYLDQVCRSLGGPLEMRQHVRQELREHLLDAVAQHQAAGMPQDAAILKAIEEFGKPDEIRTELESAHGQRMNWILDKAMQWKERTMKAKWLWMTWAVLAPTLLILLQVAFISFNVVFIEPKYRRLTHDGVIDSVVIEQNEVSAWMPGYLEGLSHVGGHYATWLLLGAIAAVALFEWRIKSENKPFIRLAALGTVAVGLTVVVTLMSFAQAVSLCVGAPPVGRLVKPFAAQQVGAVDASLAAMEQASAKQDWKTLRESAIDASAALNGLSQSAAVVRTLALHGATAMTIDEETQKIAAMRSHLKAAADALTEVQVAGRDENAARLPAALDKFRKAFAPVRDAAKSLK